MNPTSNFTSFRRSSSECSPNALRSQTLCVPKRSNVQEALTIEWDAGASNLHSHARAWERDKTFHFSIF
jgi:hypothetical protein